MRGRHIKVNPLDSGVMNGRHVSFCGSLTALCTAGFKTLSGHYLDIGVLD